MRNWLMGAALAASMAGGAFAQGNDIQGVINDQMDAFKADNFAEAFEFASPSIQNIFRTPDNFGRMVTQGFPMVWRPSEVTYLNLREDGGVYWQTVRIVDTKGMVHLLEYRMLNTDAGWKINGVRLLENAGVSA